MPEREDTPSPQTPPPRRLAEPLHMFDHAVPFSVIIFGATGDLARKKLFPALYQLVLLGHLPRTLSIVGYGRSSVVRIARRGLAAAR